MALLMALDGKQKEIWTALPGIIVSFNRAEMTCEVKPAIKAQLTNYTTNATSWVELPTLLDCPVYFPSGGGYTLAFPIAPGDECLVVFASRCIDKWWANGGVQEPLVLRMHDLSDGFVFCGVKSKPKVTGYDSQGVCLLNATGKKVLEITDDSVVITSSLVRVEGHLTVTGGITGC